MQNQESTLAYETHKVLCDFYIQTGHLISTKRPDQIIFKKN